jgi:defect-in-organelle-trafficking protein DotB
METLRMIISQSLVKTKDGKRVALREWLVFTDEIRKDLLGMENHLWPNAVQKYVEEQGRTMAQSAKIVYDQGLINKDVYKQMIKGSKLDVKEENA